MSVLELVSPLAVRLSVSHLPFQSVISWISGCPLPGEPPPAWRRSAESHIADCIAFFGIGTLLLHHPLTAPVGAVFIASRSRKTFITLIHQAIHDEFLHDDDPEVERARNRRVGEALAIWLFVPGYDAYRDSHKVSHHGRWLATPRDKDSGPIYAFGFEPGLPVNAYYRRLARTLLSPRFYATHIRDRMRASFVDVSPSRRRWQIAWTVTLLGATWATGLWHILAGTLFALFVLFPISGLFQQLTRHIWGDLMDRLGSQDRTARVCIGRYLLDPAPQSNQPMWRRALGWSRWTVRLLGYHLPCRLFILTGDVIAHDWHHRHPTSADWTIAHHARVADIVAGRPGWERHPYITTWSYLEALHYTFTRMSQAAPFIEEREAA